jgi:hypothetical protein
LRERRISAVGERHVNTSKSNSQRERDIARLRSIADRVLGPETLNRAQLEALQTEIEAAVEETLDESES